MKKRTAALTIAMAGIASVMLARAVSSAPASERPRAVSFSPCAVEGLDGRLECGELDVFENPDQRSGRVITLHFLMARASATGSARDPDPLFFLTGGPGLSAIAAAPRIVKANPRVRRTRDMVFLDQRGTGRSNPLTCAPGDPTRASPTAEDFKACHDELRTRADVRHYLTTAAAHDIEAVRVALGYGQVNLLGISYGTILAQEFMRRHPDSVRSAMLMSAYGPGEDVFQILPSGAQTALESLIADCRADDVCNREFPKLGETISEVFGRLQRGGGKSPPYHEVAQAVSLGLYRTDFSSTLPLAFRQASQGDFTLLFSVYRKFGAEFGGSYAHGLYATLLCSEDLPFTDLKRARARAAESFLRHRTLANSLDICGVWPRSPIPDDYRSPVASNVPTLIVNGGLDPVTTVESGRRVAAGLANSRYVVVRKMAHLSGQAWETCLQFLLERFLDDPDPASLDASCADDIARPPFQLSP